MKFYHLNGHNPDSPSAQARREKKLLLERGVVKCEKCGETSKTFYKITEDPKQYLCVDCYKKAVSKNS